MDDYNTKANLMGITKIKEDFTEGNCLPVVHTGAKKMLCNAAITENYKCNPKSPNKFQKFSEQLTGNTIPPTLEVALTKKKHLQSSGGNT